MALTQFSWVLALDSGGDVSLWGILLSSLGGIGAIVLAAVTVYRASSDRRNVDSSSEANISKAYQSVAEATVVILNPLNEENRELRRRQDIHERRIADLEKAVRDKENENAQLRRELHDERDRASMEHDSADRVIQQLQQRVRMLEIIQGQNGA